MVLSTTAAAVWIQVSWLLLGGSVSICSKFLPGFTLIRENKCYCIKYVYGRILDVVLRTASTHMRKMDYKDALLLLFILISRVC